MGRVPVSVYEAVGGPHTPTKMPGDRFTETPTTPGTFVIAACGKHVSPQRYAWSRIPWGAPLRETVPGNVEVLISGKWRLLKDVTPVSRSDIMKENQRLYGKSALPKTWVFNDFGHLTCYYFQDSNKNHKLDGKETLSQDFIHTTPDNEAETATGKPVVLFGSHGCIHVKPNDIDDMVQKGYLKPGNTLVVHDYDAVYNVGPVDSKGKKPFEIHFYPGANALVVFGDS